MGRFAEFKSLIFPSLLGYGLCRSLIVEQMDYSRGIFGDSFEAGFVFRFALLFAALLLALLWRHVRNAKRLRSVSIVVLLCGTIGLSLVAIGSLGNERLIIDAGFGLLGLCCGFYETKWCLRLIGLKRNELFANLFLSILLSSAIGAFALAFHNALLFYLGSLVLLLIMAACDYFSSKTVPLLGSLFAAPEVPGMPEMQAKVAKVANTVNTAKDACHAAQPAAHSPVAKNLAAVMVALFLYGIIHIVGVLILTEGSIQGSVYLLRLVANFATVAVLVGFFVARGPGKNSSLLRAILLLTMIGLLAHTLDHESVKTAALFAFLCGNKVFDVLILALMMQILAPYPAHAGKGVGGIVAAKNTGVLVGYCLADAVARVTGNSLSGLAPLLALLLIVILFWILSERVVGSERTRQSNAPEEGAGEVVAAAEAQQNAHAEVLVQLATEHGLTPREREVFLLLAQKKNRSQIAEELVVSENTVHTHTNHVYQKLGVSSKKELVALLERLTSVR